MSARRITALIIAALVLGLVAGNVASGIAAPASSAESTNPVAAACSGLGHKMGSAMRDAGGRLADVVAKLTGTDVADVQAKRAEGTSLADIAAEKGVEASTVVDEALKIREQALADRVEDGTITQEQADAALERMQTRLTERVQSTDSGFGGAGGGMGGGGRGAGGGGCGAAPVTQ